MGLFDFLRRKKPPAEEPAAADSPSPLPAGDTAPVTPPGGAEAEAATPTAPIAIPAAEPVAPAPVVAAVGPSAEELCGIDPATMDRDAIRAHLAALYRRHNAAAASLNAELRVEAEQMLDAIVECREKYIEAM